MILHVSHRITYRYDHPVIIEPLLIRLRPRSNGAQQLISWNCELTPQPLASTAIFDVFDNDALQVSFSGVHPGLVVQVESKVETLLNNPFDFLAFGAGITSLPVEYENRVAQALRPHLDRDIISGTVDMWASGIADNVGRQTQSFLLNLTSEIQRDFVSETRYDGPPRTPDETILAKRGACRDLAVLFIDACRSQGIAARFVSGYVYEPDRIGGGELHAWAEVYLPGGGWRGYDPSLGIAVADAHIAVATSPTAQWAAPTEGSYFGGSHSEIEYEVQVTNQA